MGCSQTAQGWFGSYLLFPVERLVQGSSLSCPVPDLVLKYPERLHSLVWTSLLVTMQDSGRKRLWMAKDRLRWITLRWFGSRVGTGSKPPARGVTDCPMETNEQKSLRTYGGRHQPKVGCHSTQLVLLMFLKTAKTLNVSHSLSCTSGLSSVFGDCV